MEWQDRYLVTMKENGFRIGLHEGLEVVRGYQDNSRRGPRPRKTHQDNLCNNVITLLLGRQYVRISDAIDQVIFGSIVILLLSVVTVFISIWLCSLCLEVDVLGYYLLARGVDLGVPLGWVERAPYSVGFSPCSCG